MAKVSNKMQKIPVEERDYLLETLKTRFENNMIRHQDIKWEDVQKKLTANNDKLWSISEMERTGGKPDVISYDKEKNEYVFYDCSEESPEGRRNVCYDREAMESRKKFKPQNNALDMAADMGIEILTMDQYKELQKVGEFDKKTSSWVKTPEKIRKLGGALFGDRRFDMVFIYHNGAESYYGVRGFRGLISV